MLCEGRYPEGSKEGALEHLSAAAGLGGAAVLFALRSVAAGEELLISYRDASATGALNTVESLRNYGFLSFASSPASAGRGGAAVDDDDDVDVDVDDGFAFFAGDETHEAEEAEERNRFAELVDQVLAAPGGADLSADQLLQVGSVDHDVSFCFPSFSVIRMARRLSRAFMNDAPLLLA